MSREQIACDIGGTSTRVARVGAIAHAIVFPTDQNPLREAECIAGAIASLGVSKVDDVVCGLAGVIGRDSTVHTAPNLIKFKGTQFRDALSAHSGAHVTLANDAYLGALGESVHGAGRGYSIVAYIAVGTGVGGARVVDQRADRTCFGQEPGHMLLSYRGEVKEIESWIGGKHVEKRFGKSPKHITDTEVWNELGEILGEALWALTLAWSPEVFIFGGSMMLGNPGISLLQASAALSHHNHLYPRLPELKKAELGDFPVLWGAAEVARSRLL